LVSLPALFRHLFFSFSSSWVSSEINHADTLNPGWKSFYFLCAFCGCPRCQGSTIEIGYSESERVIKIDFRFMYRLTKNWPTWAARIQLLVNPKLLRCKSFLQRGQGGPVYVGCWGSTPHWNLNLPPSDQRLIQDQQ